MPKSTLKFIKKQLRISAEAIPTPVQSAPLETANTQLLKEAYAHVTPLSTLDIYQHQPKRPSPHPRPIMPSPIDIAPFCTDIIWLNQTGNTEGFYRPGMRTEVLKRMRRKDWIVQSELDLHGLTADEAEAATQRFLTRCQQHGLQRLRIIHGKGLHSPNQESVLKQRIHQWLTQQQHVLAFTHPSAAQGGMGAMLVLIKKMTET